VRILVVVVDGMRPDALHPDTTPTMWAAARSGWWAPRGGLGELPAFTYPNHATFVTGSAPARHGVLCHRALTSDGWRRAERVGPQVPTLFDLGDELGWTTGLVAGDPNLIGVCGGRSADLHWPPGGVLPDGTPTAATACATDAATLDAVRRAGVEELDLALVQLDETDAVSHVHGPASEEVRAQLRRTDQVVAELLDRYRRRWDDTVVVVLSDHGHEEVGPRRAVELGPALDALGVEHQADGTAVLVRGAVARQGLAALAGVDGVVRVGRDLHVLWPEAGVVVGVEWGQRGDHGSPRSRSQVAVVTGGHPGARWLGERVQGPPPLARQWAGWWAGLLMADREPASPRRAGGGPVGAVLPR
jgi:hypothetical protein